MNGLYVLAGTGAAALLAILAVVMRLHRQGTIAPGSESTARIGPGDDCPACRGGSVRNATGKFGEFLGCSRYPDCQAAWSRAGIRITGRNYGRLR